MILDYIALVVVALVSGLSQLLFKRGAERVVTDQGFVRLLATLLNHWNVTGGLSVVLMPGLYIYALQNIELSTAFAFTALNYVTVLVVSRLFLKESISLRRWWGIGLILVGVTLSSL